MVNQSGSDDGQQADDLKNRRGRISVGFNLVIMIVGIAIAEILAMIIISYFISLDYYQLVIIDTSIMAIIIIPWLYIFSISPLLKQIRQQAQAESILQARQRIMEYASAHGLSDLLEYTLNEIEALTESTISFFHFMETDQKTINLQAWSTNTLQNMCKAEGKGSHYDLERAGVWADAVRQRKPIIHNDYAQQPNRKGLPEGHASVVREMVIPIIREDKVVAVLGSGNKPRDYTTNDLEIISKIGDFAWDVVDHKQADIAIQESEEKFHTLIDWTYDWELWVDTQGNIGYTSPSCERISGYTVDEFIKDPNLLMRIIHPGERQMIDDHQTVIHETSADPITLEYRIIARDGSEHWIEHICRPVFGHDGGHLGRRISNRDITKRKQAEEELRSVNAYNRSLFEANVDALVTITPDGKIGDVNAVTEAITGYPREDLIGTDFHSYFTHPDKARAGYERVYEVGMVRDYELEIHHKDGHCTPVVYNASVYQDASGKVAGVFAAARDITERRQAERQLVLLTTALEAAANAIIVADKDGRIIWANTAFSKMTGFTKEEIVGQSPSILKSGKQNREFYRNLWETILAGSVWRGELVNRRKNGSLYFEEQFITPVVDKDGSITNFISIKHDITEHKNAENALRKSEEQYRSLIIATAQIVWQTNPKGEVVEDIPMWGAFTGQSEQDAQGMGWLEALHPDDRQRTSEIWAHAVESKTIYDTEYRLRSHTGEYGYFAVRGVPITDKDGNISGWIGTCTDITEKKLYENQLIQAEKHAVIGRMVGSVTHEINNPLQTIKNCLYLIRQDTGLESPNNEPLEMALSETQRLSNLVGQLRQLYRPQAIQTMHPHDLMDLINEVHTLIKPHLNYAHVAWDPAPGLEPCTVNCVKDQIIEVILNVCMNAIEAMQPSGGILSIGLEFSDEKEQVGVMLSDTGPGIQADVLPHIFEPFITTKRYGLGLGLSICYNIIQKHGGQITVVSEPGRGTWFTIWLPIYTGIAERGE